MTWLPSLGERVIIPKSGLLGVVVHVTLTEWGFLYDIDLDATTESEATPTRRTYSTGEVAPLDEEMV